MVLLIVFVLATFSCLESLASIMVVSIDPTAVTLVPRATEWTPRARSQVERLASERRVRGV